jgi:hypothetical protein
MKEISRPMHTTPLQTRTTPGSAGILVKGVFAETIMNYGLKKKVETFYNPQSNGSIKRVHRASNYKQMHFTPWS